MTDQVRTFEVTINGTTKTVEAKDYRGDGDVFYTGFIALARTRQGQKAHPVRIGIWKQRDGSYKPSMGAVSLNKQMHIVAWNEERYEGNLSQHNGSHSGQIAK